jgi:hypothetical protein
MPQMLQSKEDMYSETSDSSWLNLNIARSLFNWSGLCLANLDPAHRLVEANVEFFQHFGGSSRERQGQSFYDLIHPASRERVRRKFDKLARAGYSHFTEQFIGIGPRKHCFTGMMRGVAVCGDNGLMNAIVVMVRPDEVATAGSSTVVTVAVFLPIAFVSGVVGQLFAPFAITVSVALAASLVVSLAVVPVFAFWLLKSPKDHQGGTEWRASEEQNEQHGLLQRLYLPIVRFATRQRLITVFAGVLVLFLTFGLASKVRTTFLDQDGQDTITALQELPTGASLTTLTAPCTR